MEDRDLDDRLKNVSVDASQGYSKGCLEGMEVEGGLSRFIEFYRRLGFNIMPLKPRSKEPIIKWEELRHRKATDDEIRIWFSRDANIGIVCGSVSGNLAVLDFESPDSFERFFDKKPEEVAETTIVVRTSRGYHAYLRTGKPVKSFKIPALQLDVKGEGGYVVAPPSIHPSGVRYEFLGDPWRLSDLQNIDNLESWVWGRAGELGVFRYGSEDDPPCIRRLLNGVNQGMRNESAVRLASYWLQFRRLDRREAFDRLLEWNTRNRPPLDERELEKCLESVSRHGYEYGCTSMAELGVCNDNLKSICSLRGSFRVERKHVRHAASAILSDGRMIEEAYRDGRIFFIVYNPVDGSISEVEEVEDGGIIYRPIVNRDVESGQVLLPSNIEEYGDEKTLFEEVVGFLDRWHEQPDRFERNLDAFYVMMTWVYDTLPCLPYRRALGRWGSGKSAWLMTVGSICYRPIVLAGCDSEASLRRTFDLWRGTALIDEADFSNSSLYAAIVKILNIGFSRDTGWFRCCNEKDPKIIDSFCVYGPKLLATRREFKDVALESKCLTFTARPGSGKTPLFRGERFKAEALRLRNKLLLWRFRNFHRFTKMAGMLEDKDLFRKEEFDPNVELRIAQIILPLYLLFKDKEFASLLKTFIEAKSVEVKTLDPDSWIEDKIPELVEKHGVKQVKQVKQVKEGGESEEVKIELIKVKVKDIAESLLSSEDAEDSGKDAVRHMARKVSAILRRNYGFTVRRESGNITYAYIPAEFLKRKQTPSLTSLTCLTYLTEVEEATASTPSENSTTAGGGMQSQPSSAAASEDTSTPQKYAPSMEDIQALLKATEKYGGDYWLASDVVDDYVRAGGKYDFWRLLDMLSSDEWLKTNPRVWLEEHPRKKGMFRVRMG
jgi:hypothetical protein